MEGEVASNQVTVTDEGLVGLYTPPREANDSNIAYGQGYGLSAFRTSRIYRILTGTVNTDAWNLGAGVVNYSDGLAAGTDNALIGTAFDKMAGDVFTGESMAGSGGPALAGDSGRLSESDTMVIAGDGTNRGITPQGSHYKVRGFLIRPVVPFAILATVAASYLRDRIAPDWLRNASSGKSLASAFVESFGDATYVRVRDQRNNSGCLEKLGNLTMWAAAEGAPRSDSWWYLDATYLSGDPGSDSVAVDFFLGDRITVESAPDLVPLTGGPPAAPAHRIVYGWEAVVVGESASGKMSQAELMRACGVVPNPDANRVKRLETRMNGMEAMIERIANKVGA